jgi:BarA-like signal transduction histidine kinase
MCQAFFSKFISNQQFFGGGRLVMALAVAAAARCTQMRVSATGLEVIRNSPDFSDQPGIAVNSANC